MKRVVVMILVALVVVKGGKPAPACVCDRRECEIVGAADCPGLGVVVWDPCRCCRECARTEGEPCGGELGFSGTCEPGLLCRHPGRTPAEGTCKRPVAPPRVTTT